MACRQCGWAGGSVLNDQKQMAGVRNEVIKQVLSHDTTERESGLPQRQLLGFRFPMSSIGIDIAATWKHRSVCLKRGTGISPGNKRNPENTFYCAGGKCVVWF